MKTVMQISTLVCAGMVAVGAWAADAKPAAKAEAKEEAKAEGAAEKTPEQIAKEQKEREALLKTKKPSYKKYAEAKAMAMKVHQPVLMLIYAKGSPAANIVEKGLLKNKLFVNDFAKKNFVVWCLELKKDPKSGQYDVSKKQTAEKKLLDELFPERTPPAYVTVLKEDMSESIFDTTMGHLPELDQPKPDLPMQIWFASFAAKMEAKKMPLIISDKLKQFMESEVEEKGEKGSKKAKK